MKRFISILVSISITLSTLCVGVQYAYSATLSAPANVVVRSSSNTEYGHASLTITWDSVAGATAYAVLATRAGSTSYSSASVSGENNTQAVILDLIGGATYVVQVRTIQDSDVGSWSSNSLVATPTTLPKSVDKPSAVPGIGSATVTWTALAGLETGGSPVTSYVVTESNSGKSISVAPSESSVEMTGLDEGAAAVFRVQALTNVSSTGSISLAADEITTLTSDGISGDPTPTAAPSAAPSSPVEIPIVPSDSPSGGSSGSGGISFGGGGAGAPPAVVPSPPATTSPSPSPSPTATPSSTPTMATDHTPLQPIATKSPSASPSPSPSPSARHTNLASPFIGVTTSNKNVQIVSLKSAGKSIAIKESKNLALVLPFQKSGIKIVVKVRVPNGSIFTLVSMTTKDYGSIKLPSLDFKKQGKYSLVISIAGKITTLGVAVIK